MRYFRVHCYFPANVGKEVVGSPFADSMVSTDLSQKATYEEVVHKIEAHGAKVHYPLPLTHSFDPIFEFNGQSGYLLILREFHISSN